MICDVTKLYIQLPHLNTCRPYSFNILVSRLKPRLYQRYNVAFFQLHDGRADGLRRHPEPHRAVRKVAVEEFLPPLAHQGFTNSILH